LSRPSRREEQLGQRILATFPEYGALKIRRPDRPRPGVTNYLAVVAMPVFGFLLPWGTLRVVCWVLQGFVVDWRSARTRKNEPQRKDAENLAASSPGKESP